MANIPPTRERILEAAIAAIESGGEASLRVDAIAESAEITKPSIYHFFGDRDGLIAAAQAERYRLSVVSGLDQAIALTRAATSRDEFEALLPVFVDVAMDSIGALRRAERIQVLGSAVSRPKLTIEIIEATKRAVSLTSELLAIAIHRGWITPTYSEDAIALWWLSLTMGRHLFDLIDDDQLHLEWRAMALANLRLLCLGEL
jgi:AcrR family transcriptional regulator